MRLQPPRQLSAQLCQSRDARIDVKQLARQRRARSKLRFAWKRRVSRLKAVAGAIYDVFMTAAFATPWTFWLLPEQLSSLNVSLGGVPLPLFVPELAWGLAQSLPLHPGEGARGGLPHESLLR